MIHQWLFRPLQRQGFSTTLRCLLLACHPVHLTAAADLPGPALTPEPGSSTRWLPAARLWSDRFIMTPPTSTARRPLDALLPVLGWTCWRPTLASPPSCATRPAPSSTKPTGANLFGEVGHPAATGALLSEFGDRLTG